MRPSAPCRRRRPRRRSSRPSSRPSSGRTRRRRHERDRDCHEPKADFRVHAANPVWVSHGSPGVASEKVNMGKITSALGSAPSSGRRSVLATVVRRRCSRSSDAARQSRSITGDAHVPPLLDGSCSTRTAPTLPPRPYSPRWLRRWLRRGSVVPGTDRSSDLADVRLRHDQPSARHDGPAPGGVRLRFLSR
jgi:hypothetical protein